MTSTVTMKTVAATAVNMWTLMAMKMKMRVSMRTRTSMRMRMRMWMGPRMGADRRDEEAW